jgi:hypothetical protein
MAKIFYKKERIEFSEAFNQRINRYHIEVITRKIIRHYNLYNIELKFKNRKIDRATCNYFPYDTNYCNKNSVRIKIIINKISVLGTLIHELTHAIEIRRYGKTRHANRMFRMLKSTHNYVKNNISIQEMLNNYNKAQSSDEDKGIFECDINNIESIIPASDLHYSLYSFYYNNI